MNKKEFIAIKKAENEKLFGRWGSDKKICSASRMKLIFNDGPKNELEALQHGNALANTGNYPVGTSECFNVGISGGCCPDCFIYLKGKCEEPDPMFECLSEDDKTRHIGLYGNPNEKYHEGW